MDRNDEHQVTKLRAGGKGNWSSKTVAKGSVRKPIAVVASVSDSVVESPPPANLTGATNQKPHKNGSTTSLHDAMNHTAQSAISRVTHGLSPAALMGAWFDWATHITAAPGKQLQLVEKAADKARRQASFAMSCAQTADTAEPCIAPLPQDNRFNDEAWQMKPFNMVYQGFLLQQQWWHNVVTDVPGVTAQHERELQFLTRQVLDMYSPSNFLPTNPEVLRKTRDEAGQNLIRGMQNLVEDAQSAMTGASPEGAEGFQPGQDVAVTPGKVVYRNRLIELIQYAPVTDTVHPEPILIVPAWIMKYYILDLSEQNSMVRYLVEQGYTVFMISWKNPIDEDRDLTMEDYRQLGVMAAIEAIQAIVPDQKIHATGYCLGGTLLAIAAAAIARGKDDPFASLTLLASQVDFTKPGELQLFINESQLAFLDSVMWKQGYLDTTQMGGAFQMLRSNDLIWSRAVREYLMGERQPMNDLMAWNADGTRMPFAMHSEYLEKLYLNNDLSEGRFQVEDRPVALSDIRAPIFAVGTVKDHVAPWHSVFKIQALTDTDVTFVLTSGGHNAGIVSEPGHPRRTYRIASKDAMDRYVDPEAWQAETEAQDGSWWESWVEWLGSHSGKQTAPPDMGDAQSGYTAFADAPGTYVLQK
ncbi:alpha/beta fold hydrolase [uncultured Aliiroseovarius sp.]|uniref:PHA/PHB synthase family protein n=1 Tax=uncultured Aliiroseovarius sp. TaxID=1658783 RepID=UPI00262BC18C|nr:alpha/beta fold hydrolase [uncultured Aliiroseovarius sp.]